MLATVRKDAVLTKQQCMVVYQYVCRCDYQYVGRTSQRLKDRIKQHIPKAIRNQTQPDHDLFQSNSTSTSAMGQHFYLSTLKAALIKMLKPELCRQKEFVYTLKLHHSFGLEETSGCLPIRTLRHYHQPQSL